MASLRLATLGLVLSATLLAAGAGARPAAPPLTVQPWTAKLPFVAAIAFLPDGRALATEKDTGVVRLVEANGTVRRKPFAKLHVFGYGEFGLLGIAVDPAFPSKPFVYVYYTEATKDGKRARRHRLVRFRWANGVGVTPRVLLDNIYATPGSFHAGGALAFLGPNLLVTVGDPEKNRFTIQNGRYEPASLRSQDTKVIYGKILRLTRDGRPAHGNPFGNRVYAYGIRNSFGLAVDPLTKAVFETENSSDSDDEVNRIVAGGNYGWPYCQGSCALGYENPLWTSGETTSVPVGIVSYRDTKIKALRDTVVFCNFKYGSFVALKLDQGQARVMKSTELASKDWLCAAPLVADRHGDLVFQDLKSGRLLRITG